MVTEGFVNLRNTLWRWNRDSNPGRVSPHTLSKRADSAALAFHPIYFGGLAEPDPPSLATAVARSIYFEGLAEPDASQQKAQKFAVAGNPTAHNSAAEGCFVPDLTWFTLNRCDGPATANS